MSINPLSDIVNYSQNSTKVTGYVWDAFALDAL